MGWSCPRAPRHGRCCCWWPHPTAVTSPAPEGDKLGASQRPGSTTEGMCVRNRAGHPWRPLVPQTWELTLPLSLQRLLTSPNLSVLWTQKPAESWLLKATDFLEPGWMCSEKPDAFIRDLQTTATPVVGMWPVLPARRAACEGLESARVPHGGGGRPESMWTPLGVQSGGQTAPREATLDRGPLLPHWWGETSLL